MSQNLHELTLYTLLKFSYVNTHAYFQIEMMGFLLYFRVQPLGSVLEQPQAAPLSIDTRQDFFCM